MLEITSESQLSQVLHSAYDLLVIDIYANWCGPCKFLAPKLEAMEKEYNASPRNVLFCKLNSELNLRSVQGLPTLEFWVKDGGVPRKVHQIMGADLQEIQATLAKYAPTVSTPPPPSFSQHNPAIRNVSNQAYRTEQPIGTSKPKSASKGGNYKTFSGMNS